MSKKLALVTIVLLEDHKTMILIHELLEVGLSIYTIC